MTGSDQPAGIPPRLVLPRLYAILDVDLTSARGLRPLEVLDAWLDAGIRLVQLRAKSLALGPFLELADAVVLSSRRAGATSVINDRADVAALSGADGVHVGQDDLRVVEARQVVGPTAIVGLSTHADAQVRAALVEPVSYIAIGPVFTTSSKSSPDPVVGLDGVRRARAESASTGLPLVAIGGITIATAPDVIEAGATSVAIISDLVSTDIQGRARAWLRALN